MDNIEKIIKIDYRYNEYRNKWHAVLYLDSGNFITTEYYRFKWVLNYVVKRIIKKKVQEHTETLE